MLFRSDNQERLVQLWAKVVRSCFQNLKNSSSPIYLVSAGSVRIYLEAEDLWLDQVERLSVNLNKTLSGLYTLVSIPFPISQQPAQEALTLQWATAVAVFFLPKH